MLIHSLCHFHAASATNPSDACFYADTHDLVWNKGLNCWTKDSSRGRGAMAGRSGSTIRLSPSPSPERHSTPTLPSYGCSTTSLETETEGSVTTLRTATPPGYPQRPLSQVHGTILTYTFRWLCLLLN